MELSASQTNDFDMQMTSVDRRKAENKHEYMDKLLVLIIVSRG